MTELTLDDAAPADVPAMPALLAQLGYPADAAVLPARLERIRAGGGRVVVARQGEAVVGLMAVIFLPMLHHEDDLCRVASLVVAGHARRGGVGRKLMEFAERLAREHGCARIEVASAAHRAPAHAFYTSLGYADRPRRFVKQLTEAGHVPPGAQPAHVGQQSPGPEPPGAAGLPPTSQVPALP